MLYEKRWQLRDILYHYSIRNIPICGVSVATMVHEYGHLISSILLGFGGTIFSGKPWAVYPLVKPVGDQWILFYLSGGLFQFIVFYLMSLRANDLNTKIANRMTALIGLIEGITEPIRYLRLTGLGATLGITVSFLYLAYVLVKESEIE